MKISLTYLGTRNSKFRINLTQRVTGSLVFYNVWCFYYYRPFFINTWKFLNFCHHRHNILGISIEFIAFHGEIVRFLFFYPFY